MVKKSPKSTPQTPLSTDGFADLSSKLFSPNLKPPRQVNQPVPPTLAMSKLPPPAEIDERHAWRVRRFRLWRDNAPSLLLAVLDPRRRNHLRRYQSFVIPTESTWVKGNRVFRFDDLPRPAYVPSPLILPHTPYRWNPAAKVAKAERKARYQRLLQYKYALDQEHERRFRQGMRICMGQILDFERTSLKDYSQWDSGGAWKDVVNLGNVIQITGFFKDIVRRSSNIFFHVSDHGINAVPRRDEVHKAIKAEDKRKENRRADKERKKQEQAAQQEAAAAQAREKEQRREVAEVCKDEQSYQDEVAKIQERLRKTQAEINWLKSLQAEVAQEEEEDLLRNMLVPPQPTSPKVRRELQAVGKTEEERKREEEREKKRRDKRKRQKHEKKLREKQEKIEGQEGEPELTDASTVSTPSVTTPTSSSSRSHRRPTQPERPKGDLKIPKPESRRRSQAEPLTSDWCRLPPFPSKSDRQQGDAKVSKPEPRHRHQHETGPLDSSRLPPHPSKSDRPKVGEKRVKPEVHHGSSRQGKPTSHSHTSDTSSVTPPRPSLRPSKTDRPKGIDKGDKPSIKHRSSDPTSTSTGDRVNIRPGDPRRRHKPLASHELHDQVAKSLAELLASMQIAQSPRKKDEANARSIATVKGKATVKERTTKRQDTGSKSQGGDGERARTPMILHFKPGENDSPLASLIPQLFGGATEQSKDSSGPVRAEEEGRGQVVYLNHRSRRDKDSKDPGDARYHRSRPGRKVLAERPTSSRFQEIPTGQQTSDRTLECPTDALPDRLSVTRVSSPLPSTPSSHRSSPRSKPITPTHRAPGSPATAGSDNHQMADPRLLSQKLQELGAKLQEYAQPPTPSPTPAPTVFSTDETHSRPLQAETYRYGSLNLDADTAAPPFSEPRDSTQRPETLEGGSSAAGTMTGSESADSYASEALPSVDFGDLRSIQGTREFTERDTEITARPPRPPRPLMSR